ncbi:hypothetical protein F5X99DRAFT_430348 [Biscogniauxia marginata]|nr:hypothetical protein F5X99DRAFT_430348 [Biscogniauxia marginata]
MASWIDTLIGLWHGMLGLQRQPAQWYRERLREELREQRQATTSLQRLSETADVYYSISRARHDGHPVRRLPRFRASHHALPYLYMVGKFTSRWAFYRAAARLSGAADPAGVREVVNPARDLKLREVALRHGIDPSRFHRVCRRLLRVWPLLP